MIASEISIACATASQLAAIGSFVWPAGSKPGRMIPLTTLETKLENCCTEGAFENVVTGLAVHLVKHYPSARFHINAWLDNPESYYKEKMSAGYDGTRVLVHIDTEDYMFKEQKKCIDCGAELAGVFDTSGFRCPSCNSLYLPTGHPDVRTANQVFGDDSCTYSIPREEIEN